MKTFRSRITDSVNRQSRCTGKNTSITLHAKSIGGPLVRIRVLVNFLSALGHGMTTIDNSTVR